MIESGRRPVSNHGPILKSVPTDSNRHPFQILRSMADLLL